MKLTFDFHIHSKYSYDCISKIGAILKCAKRAKLRGIAITDHEKFKGNLDLEEIAKKKYPELILIKGEEIETEFGDITGLFLKKEIRSRKFFDVVKEIKKQGGIVVLPHPARNHILNDKIMKDIDVIEIFNSKSNKETNKMAELLAKKYGKPVLAGSDANALEIGFGKTIVFSKNETLQEIKKAILNKKTKIIGKRPGKIRRILAFFLVQIIQAIKK